MREKANYFCVKLFSEEIYTDFINGGSTVVMKTRRYRINNFCVKSDLGEFERFYRVLKIFFVEQGVCFIFLVEFQNN